MAVEDRYTSCIYITLYMYMGYTPGIAVTAVVTKVRQNPQ